MPRLPFHTAQCELCLRKQEELASTPRSVITEVCRAVFLKVQYVQESAKELVKHRLSIHVLFQRLETTTVFSDEFPANAEPGMIL